MVALKLNPRKIPKDKLAHLWEVHRRLVRHAARNREAIVWGKAHGPEPRFFIVGDEPRFQDYITSVPFSGAMNQVLVNAVETLRQKFGCTIRDTYTTYFVKTTFLAEDLTEEMFMKEWLPAVQLEYALSGCEYVVAMTGNIQAVQAHIANTPQYLIEKRLSLGEKLSAAWEVLKS